MADDLSKRGRQDRNNVSNQRHELSYIREKLREEFPNRYAPTIAKAVTEAKREVGPSESRTRVMNAARKILGG